MDYYLLLKYCKRQCALLSPIWTKSLTVKILPRNARFETFFELYLQVKKGLNN